MKKEDLIEKINTLKKQKNATILVHNYQRPEIYEVADFLGDSLELSIKAKESGADIIVFCGVDFMAESAKILSPEKKILIPVKDAVCPMARMVTREDLIKEKKRHPSAAVACYINTTADVKAESDICTTSANAPNVISSLKETDVLFVPDRNLAQYAQSKTCKKIMPWNGYCYVHDSITKESAIREKALHPGAKLIAHPECRPEITAIADEVCSTSRMITYSQNSESEEFIVATETGMIERLKKELPGKKFYPLGGICENMKKTTLKDVHEALQKEQFEVTLDGDIIEKARKPLERMVNIRK